jgi:hypothetical protein
MGARGPAKRPEYLKVLSGTDRADRPADASPIALDSVITELPNPPDWVADKEARESWVRLGGDLLKRGLLDEARLELLGFYCSIGAKIKARMSLGEMPTAALVRQHASIGKELRILGTQTKQPESAAQTAKTSRLASIKERANRAD